MKIKHKFCCLLSIGIICSCASFKTTQLREDQIELTTNNLELLNGTYYLNPSNEVKTGDLFWLYSTNIFKKDHFGEKNFYYVNLQKIDKHQLKVTFLNSNYMVLKSRTLSGRIKNGFFITSGKVIFIPFILVNAIGTAKIRIGLLKNSNLMLDHRNTAFGNFLIYPIGGTTYKWNIEYIKWEY